MMPEMSGLQVIQEVKKDKTISSIPILILTAKGTETDEIVGLEVGADDYIIKPVKIGKIICARACSFAQTGKRDSEIIAAHGCYSD